MIPTARNFYLYATNIDYIENYMIAFAKMHVEAALLEAIKVAEWKETPTMQGVQISLIKSSILDAYPLTNIK